MPLHDELHAGGHQDASGEWLPFRAAWQGDHDIWFSPVTQRHFVVDSKILSRHTANAVMKQAGIVHKF